jgi:ketosteroid isomerase-like protein
MLGSLVASAAAFGQSDRKSAAAIIAADQEFNQAVADRNRERFLSFIADSATFVGTTTEMRGHDEIWKGWQAFFQKDGPTLSWRPTAGEVLVGGDVGYTVGSWVRRTKGPDGKPVETLARSAQHIAAMLPAPVRTANRQQEWRTGESPPRGRLRRWFPSRGRSRRP